MRQEYQFDKATGTMVPVSTPQPVQNSESEAQQLASSEVRMKSNPLEETQLKLENAASHRVEVLRMKRTDEVTPVQLVNADGVPESYLDSDGMGINMFRERDDYDIYQIIDERTNKPLLYIGGYALSIKFNMVELNSMDKVDQCLQGLNKLFKKIILDQALSK